ncbi:MAG TPA: hypothetical protein VMQ17_08905 [Candidatus Sulfotelmatobacter sp.]|nr:hypothetical protein [Candidatus Sulfotelmatobacter sp.]
MLEVSTVDLLFAAGAVVIVEILCCMAFRDLGYARGLRDGLAKGRDSEADFWIGIEKQVDRERQRLWEQEKKGEWL